MSAEGLRTLRTKRPAVQRSRSFETLQIVEQRVEIVWREGVRGHVHARLRVLRIEYPAGQVTARTRECARGKRHATRDVREIGSCAAPGRCALDRMAHDACGT